MSETSHPSLPANGAGAPPRLNGELVFDAPWQSRAFGVAAALAEQGAIDWSDFQLALISQVGSVDNESLDTGEPSVYWTCWLEALGSLTSTAGIVGGNVWEQRSVALANRPAGHDHG